MHSTPVRPLAHVCDRSTGDWELRICVDDDTGRAFTDCVAPHDNGSLETWYTEIDTGIEYSHEAAAVLDILLANAQKRFVDEAAVNVVIDVLCSYYRDAYDAENKIAFSDLRYHLDYLLRQEFEHVDCLNEAGRMY